MNIHTSFEILLNIPGLKIDAHAFKARVIPFECSLTEPDNIWPHCGRTCIVINDTKERKMRDLNIADREVYLSVKVHQFYCSDCTKYHTEPLDAFADSQQSYTRRQGKFIFEVCRKQTYSKGGTLFNMNSKTVERYKTR